MRIVRGRAGTIDDDRAVTETLADDVRETGEATVRAWTPHRQVAFGRRDARSEGFEAASAAAEAHGFPPYVRRVGGRAVAYTGTTVAFARFEPVADIRQGMGDRYDRALADVARGLGAVGVTAVPGEPPESFCPGAHSLQVETMDGPAKVVGLAQRIGRGVATTAGICVVADHVAIAAVLEPVYDALGVPFDPRTVGSVALAGGDGDHEAVCRALERSLAGDDAVVETLDDGRPTGER